MSDSSLSEVFDDNSDSDYDDPLFGVQKKKKLEVPKPKMTQVSIFDALRSHNSRQDALGTELGFAIKEKDSLGIKRLHSGLDILDTKIKRSKHVDQVIQDVENRINDEREQELRVEQFLNNNINREFREETIIEDGESKRKNQKYIDDIKKLILESIQKGDFDLIPKRFKFFISLGEFDDNGGTNWESSNINSLIRSNEPSFVEAYQINGNIEINFTDLMKQLGCDYQMLYNGPELKFDSKDPLPWSLSVQVLKFVKIIEHIEISNNNIIEIIKALLMMVIDQNLQDDLHVIEYNNMNWTGRQVAVHKVMELAVQYTIQFTEIMKTFFEFDTDLWFCTIKYLNATWIPNNKTEHEILNIILLSFMVENHTADGCQFHPENGQDSVIQFTSFVSQWSECILQPIDSPPFTLILNKFQCLERLFLINFDNIISNDSISTNLKLNLSRMKKSYFKNHYGSLSPVIPKSRSILEFLIQRLGNNSIEDFFING